MTTRHYFHFTLGPVQAFVAQARRTRDFWAGSFLLSWLSAVAMKTVQAAGDGEVLFPIPDADFMAALASDAIGPRHGSIPNRFVAAVPAAFDDETAVQVVQSVRSAWRGLAKRVWEYDLEGHAVVGDQTREIWDRQINAFWDASWVITESRAASALDRRKNWRSHGLPDEAGVKCAVMEGWQELSGTGGPRKADLDAFWEPLRDRDHAGVRSDLREGEHLCAIAYVKRRFARFFAGLAVAMPGAWTARGWALPAATPSTMYMAAAPWLAEVIRTAPAERLSEFYIRSMAVDPDRPEWDNEVRCVRQAREDSNLPYRTVKPFASLDAGVFFEHVLENPRVFPNQHAVPEAREALRKLRKEAGNIGPPSPFYAVLLMDGDSLGKHMSDVLKQSVISTALAEFTAQVSAIVDRYSGFTIYAGGDDVLALLPIEYAFPCALALRIAYMAAFETSKQRLLRSADRDFPTTLSGAVELAHVKMPLGRVLSDAHTLLDDVAKDGRGRDAIACRIWKPGGRAVQWAMPWERAIRDGHVEIQRLADEFRGQDDEEEGFANRFFYRIEERFELLNPPEDTKASILSADEATSLMAAELLNSSRTAGGIGMATARQRIAPLLEQCRPVTRKLAEGEPAPTFVVSRRLEADGALLVRFLAHKGVDE